MFVENSKGHQQLDHNGYKFNEDRVRKYKDGSRRWFCSRHGTGHRVKCYAYAYTKKINDVIMVCLPNNHCHPPSEWSNISSSFIGFHFYSQIKIQMQSTKMGHDVKWKSSIWFSFILKLKKSLLHSFCVLVTSFRNKNPITKYKVENSFKWM